MSNKLLYLMIPVVLLITLGLSISIVFSQEGDSSQDNRISPKTDDDRGGISWGKPIRQKGSTMIPGAVKTSFGRLELRWIIGPGEQARLVTLEAPGAGELPPMEKKILIWVRDDGTTLLFQEWIPLVNENKPITIREIVSVDTKELFSVLPGNGVPPEAALIKKNLAIEWGKKYQRNSVQYLPGELITSWLSGGRDIYWMKKPGRIPELFAPGDPDQGKRNAIDSKLYLWLDEMNGATGLFSENDPESGHGNTSYLWPFAVVETDQLISGFQEMQQDRKNPPTPRPESD